MKITLKIYSGLRKYVKHYHFENGITLNVHKEKSIKQFLIENIDHRKAIDAISMVTVNDKLIPYSDYDQKLEDGDIVKVFPPISGG